MRLKLLPLVGGLLFIASVARAGDIFKEAPITREGTAITVSVSTSAWTLGNSATSAIATSQRSGFRVTNPSTNTSSIFCICHPSAPSEAITVKINEAQKGSNITMPCGPGENLYLISINATAESVGVWEVGQ